MENPKPREKKQQKNQCFQISNHTHTQNHSQTVMLKKNHDIKDKSPKKEKKIDQPPIHIYKFIIIIIQICISDMSMLSS